jgi:hypothetical protein
VPAVSHTVCVFCGATGATVKISKEHTFSNWINEVLTPAVVGAGLSFERSVQHGPQAGTSNVWPVTKVASHEVRAVCKPCNEGWMQDLEIQVRPLIEPMILGYNTTLAPDQQMTVATWAALKAVVFEYAWGTEPVLTQADRAIIMTQNRPPASVQVRLAAVESHGYPLTARALGYLRTGTADIAYCLTLSIGCLVIQIFGGPGADHHGFQVPGNSGPTYYGIYPPAMQTVQWPPPRALDDATLHSFADPLRVS